MTEPKTKLEMLTDEERGRIEDMLFEAARFDKPALEKALRIIDAHAADRAALVAQLEAANGLLHRALDKDPMVRRDIRVFFKQPGIVPPAHAALVAQVAELTRERDEARAQLKDARRWFRVNGKKFIASPVAANELEGIIRGK